MTVQTVVPGQDQRHKAPRGVPELVRVPEAGFVMIDGLGDPNSSPVYRDAVEALYALSYTLRFSLKKAEGLEFKVGPLEGLWWAEDMAEFSVERKADWRWTMMIAQPDAVTAERFEQARAEVAGKKGLPAVDLARLARFEEGECAQILHVGPFAAEGPTIATLHAFIRAQGLFLDQKHHEIYLSDPRRAAPDKWKTIVRQPVTAQ